MYIYRYVEMLDETEETSYTVNVRNKAANNIILYYVVCNTTCNEGL